MSPAPTVDAVEARILGVLVEKQMTTPDTYPLTLAGVVAGCNQATSRDPVLSLDENAVEQALVRLHDAGLATPVRRPGDRATKYRHKLIEALEIDSPTVAVLAVLMLRGEQTSGELRSRTERYTSFATIDEVEAVIDRLEEAGLVRRLSRQPGQSQRRVAEAISTSSATPFPAPKPEEPPETSPDLATRLSTLEERFNELLRRLGEEDL
ncbi:MAG: DUF480 domain-containing protein [Acidimicrobiia bacterium]